MKYSISIIKLLVEGFHNFEDEIYKISQKMDAN